MSIAGDPDAAPLAHPVGKALVRAIVAGLRHDLADKAAERMRLASLDVLVVGADVADVREGEDDDLLRVRRVGHHFLVAGHGSVEAQLADRFALRRRSPAPISSGRRRTRRLRSRPLVGARAEVVRRPWAKEPSVKGFPAMSLRHSRYAHYAGGSTLVSVKIRR